MPNPSTIKQQFLKKWLAGLRACTSSTKPMEFVERKRAIKLAADLAMASTRNGATRWSRAIIAKSAESGSCQALPKHLLDRDVFVGIQKDSGFQYRRKKLVLRKISRRVSRKRNYPSRSIAKKMVRKRTKVLRSLVPGGEFIEDEVSLIEETLDYMTFLKAQVDAMRLLLLANQNLNHIC